MVEGTQVGAYRVLRRIGEGGMGSVWLAEHAMLGRRAAIKVLHPEYCARKEIVARFFNEARAATAITDPGIVQIFDFGHHTDGSAYIAMELLEGEALDRRLERTGSQAVGDALRIMRQVASTLGAAHAQGIVHRDLKPENIFIVPDPEVPGGERAKILDFGIAKLTGDTAPSVKTQTSALMGTPTYMSPEQCRGAGGVDQRSDVYALGCVLFTLLTGQPPFVAEGLGTLIVMHMSYPPPAPSSLRAGLPPEVDALVLRCLAKDPAQRFASAADLARAIGMLTGSMPGLGANVPGSSGAYVASKPTTLSAATGAMMQPPSRRSSGILVAAIAGTVIVGGVVAIAVQRRADHPAPPPAVAAAPAPAPAPAPAAADPKAEVGARMKDALGRFGTWAKAHDGAPCPDAAALGDVKDPWGHAFAITCTDQPGDQIIGLVSAGPDGSDGTADDIASWQLGHDVTSLVHGARWTVAVAKPGIAKPLPAKPKSQPQHPSGGVQLDENGLPISR
jgi:eukaryotic-like serine/threonine-protein kinase